MENLYDVLEIDLTASQTEIKKAYQKLALKYHPDKQDSTENKNYCDLFQRLSNAWTILGDSEKRRQYDALWHYRCTILNSFGPIHEKVRLTDFKKCTDTNEYLYECRCSDYVTLTEQEVELKMDVINCDTCSLNIQVDYN